jgi:hypothetical protein
VQGNNKLIAIAGRFSVWRMSAGWQLFPQRETPCEKYQKNLF